MSNDYYNHSSWPATGAPGASAPARSELNNITAGFNKLPSLSGNAGKAVIINGAGTALSTTTGTLTLAGNFATSGAYALTLTVAGATNVTLPTTGTLATLAGSEELTNKTLTAAVAKGTWTASGTWTLPGFTAGGLITATASAAISNSDGSAVIRLDTTNASSRGSAISFAQNGTVRGYVGVSGFVLGTTASDMAVYADTGKTINLWANGQTTIGLQVNSTGAAVTGVLSATKNANADQSFTLTNTTAGTASAVRVDLVSDSSAGQLTLVAHSSLVAGTAFGVTAAKLKAVYDNSSEANTSGLVVGTVANVPLYLVANYGVVATVSAAGVAVTGVLSATGKVTSTVASGENLILNKNAGGFIAFNDQAGTTSHAAIGATSTYKLEFHTGSSLAKQFEIQNVGSAVNYLSAYGRATGSPPGLVAAGSDTDVSFELSAKGAGTINALSPLAVTGTLSVSAAGGNVSWGGGTAITTLKQTNLDSNPTGYASFSRVGDWVTVCGYAVCDPTAAGTIEFRLVPPGPSTTFTGPTEAFGVVTGGSTAYGSLYSDAVNNRVLVSASASSGAAFTVYFSFQYKVL